MTSKSQSKEPATVPSHTSGDSGSHSTKKTRARKTTTGRGRIAKDAPYPLPEPMEDVALIAFQSETYSAIGKAIRAARLKRGLTMKMVYEATGIERTFYARLELGEVNVSLLFLRKIATVMRMTVHELMAQSGL